jgi:hypothetical protein
MEHTAETEKELTVNEELKALIENVIILFP